MAFGLKEAFAIGSLVLPFFGGKSKDRLTDEATGKFSTSGDGLMSKLFGVGEGMFGNLLMGKFEAGEKASSRALGYTPDLPGALDVSAVTAAGDIDKLATVDPATNDRLFEVLLTKMATSPVYRETS